MPIKPTYLRDNGLHGVDHADLALLFFEVQQEHQLRAVAKETAQVHTISLSHLNQPLPSKKTGDFGGINKPHQKIEVWTQLCNLKDCKEGKACKNAHNIDELIIGNLKAGYYDAGSKQYKSSPCPSYYSKDPCLARKACRFYHRESQSVKKKTKKKMEIRGRQLYNLPPPNVRNYDSLAAE